MTLIDRDALNDAVSELIDGWDTPTDPSYVGRLVALLPEPSAMIQEGKAHRKISASPPPWRQEAASLLFEIHAAVREHEATLVWLAFSGTRRRSGSDLHTRRAMRELPDLIMVCHDRFPLHNAPHRAAADLLGWPRRARVLFDEIRDDEQQPTKAPGRLFCTYCESRLLIEPGWQHNPTPHVWCPRCRDSEGQVVSWPADAWLGVLTAPPERVKQPWSQLNTGSGRA